MHQLKVLHPAAIPRALDRAERYRLLNEPWEAESICRDIIAAEPENQKALVTLLLALTDQFGGHSQVTWTDVRAFLPRIKDEYERTYYAGVVSERWAKAGLRNKLPGAVVHTWFDDALQHYAAAEKLAPVGNEDAILRWNACVRILQANEHLQPHDESGREIDFTDSVPSE